MSDEHGDLYDETLAREIEEQEAAEAAEAEEDARGSRANDLLMAGLAEESLKRADEDADSLVGAQIGNLMVLTREKPGRRPFYVCRDQRNGREVRLRGFQLVREARKAVTNGLPISMPREPWRDEDGAA